MAQWLRPLSPRMAALAVAVGFALPAAAAGAGSIAPPPPEAIPEVSPVLPQRPDRPRRLVEFELTNQTGGRVSHADLTNRYVVVSFVFTGCGNTCVRVSRQMEAVHGLTADQPDVLLLSVTVDPRSDTVRVLSEFARQFKADGRAWHFLTGRKSAVNELLEGTFLERRPAGAPQPGTGEAKGPAWPGDFLGVERIAVVDRQGAVRGYFDGLSPATPCSVTNFLAELRRETPATAAASYPARGIVRAIAPDRKTVTIRHEAIPGFMPRMTMNFTVPNPAELAPIREGDDVEFRLHVTDEDHWIDQLRRRGQAPPGGQASAQPVPPPRPAPFQVGDSLPGLDLLDEQGRSRTLQEFRGSAIALTFIFTRCPLPNFCPRMSKHFSRARQQLLARPQGPRNWQFLSLSFDPEFDSPKVLTRYARTYRADNPDRWLFASVEPTVLEELAPRLDFQFSRADGSFSHNLRTIVIDARGRIHRFFDGSDWTPDDLAAALTEAAAP